MRTRLIAVLLIAACASVGDAKMEKNETNPQFKGGKGTKVLTLVATHDPGMREDVETQFTVDGVEHSLDVTPSHRLLPDFKEITRERLGNVARTEGFDRVLVVRTVPNSMTKGEKLYVTDYYTPVNTYSEVYNAWQGTTLWLYSTNEPSPSLGEYRTVLIETLFYDTSDGTLIWNSLTRLTTSRHRGEATADFVRANLGRLTALGLL